MYTFLSSGSGKCIWTLFGLLTSFQLYTLGYFLHYLIKVTQDGLQEFY